MVYGTRDVSHLGGMMGTEYTTEMFTKYFTSAEHAKEYAHKQYSKVGGRGKHNVITWKKSGDKISSGDLGCSFMYTIKPVKVEIKPQTKM